MRTPRLLLLSTVLWVAHTVVEAGEYQSITYFDVTGLRDAYPSRIITLSHISPMPLVVPLRRYIPAIEGSFVAITPIASVILTDSPEKIALFTRLLNILDSHDPSVSGRAETAANEIAELMAQIAVNHNRCGNRGQSTAGSLHRHSVPLGTVDQKWVPAIANFLNFPKSVNVAKDENTISFDDTEEKYAAIKSLVQGLQNIPLKETFDVARTDHAVTELQRFTKAVPQDSNSRSDAGTVRCN